MVECFGFPSPYLFNKIRPMTLVELRMRFYSGKIRAKPRWWEEVHDPATVAKWRLEILVSDKDNVERFWGGEERVKDEGADGKAKQWPREPITETQLDYVIDELKYEASKRDEATGIFATSVPGVYESQRELIPPELKMKFIAGVSVLENVPEEKKDWHPGSNKQVLDLLDPSLYPLCMCRSLVNWAIQYPRHGGLAEIDSEVYIADRIDLASGPIGDGMLDFAISDEYQWLPTDFVVSDAGEATSKGYINNLHPIRHRGLHATITSVLARFVPLFECVLADARASLRRKNPIRENPYDWYDDIEEPEPDEDTSRT